MDALGIAPQTSPLSGMQEAILGITSLFLAVGIIWLIAGLVLAFVLWRKGKKGDQA